ncbi:MAG: glycosyltransferase family 2 protein [Candidatus Sulfotelmatobacter sp.]
MTDTTTKSEQVGTFAPAVSVIVPARNEEACLADCLASLLAQTGVTFEIIVVDDHSTDRTREIAASFSGVRVIDASPLPAGWTGKNNAVAAGAQIARGEWLLFTDADTVHLPGSLARSVSEAKQHDVALLSYSPAQIVKTFWEKAVMPVIFSELALRYRPSDVNDPNSRMAAANGQYILIRRDVYTALRGHAAIAGDLLEDVALARRVKESGKRIFFRYGGDAVRTRMYRNFAQLREGWTKNLAILFPRPRWLALQALAGWLLAWFAPILAVLFSQHRPALTRVLRIAICLLPLARLYAQIRRAHFPFAAELHAMAFGPPMFAYLLRRSARAHDNKTVAWKGRRYAQPENKTFQADLPAIASQPRLRTEN